MRAAIFILALGIVGTMAAQPVVPAVPRGTNVGPRAHFIEKNGGLVCRRPTGPVLVFLNAQHEVPTQQIEAVAGELDRFLGIPNVVRVVDAKGSGVELAGRVLKEGTNLVAFVVVLISESGAPSLLVAPENRWAVVNVQALRSDTPDDTTFKKRVQREQWRAVCYVVGAANSSRPSCAMSPVFVPQDLDSLALTASPEPFSRMRSSLERMGMHPSTFTTYRQAVEQGWAPDPTNDIQRAIWREVKKTPPPK